MMYQCSIVSEFAGLGNTTQLINRDVNRDLYPFHITTDGQYELDTSEWYSHDAVVNANSESWLELFTDMPGVPVGRTFITIQDSFEDYIRFKPDGADSIWITIARIDWSWLGIATDSNDWVPPSGNVVPPIEFEDDGFPFWLDVTYGVGGS